MKLLTKLSLAAVITLTLFSCAPESLDDKADALIESTKVIPPKSIELEILELINNYRLSEGLNPLQSMTIIKSTAFTHTDYMVDTQTVSHANFFTRSNYLKSNAGAKSVSENVAYGYSSAQSVVNAWMRSESHKKNIEGDFTNFEVSAEKDIDGRWYFTNIFIKK
ncbi:CAP domain-containing protein [Hyunsoonleella flava]|uniref:CAP domain-containing protein n=1 Tax=Hyunsoonleella flava TaxID=2527939 RepID=A0A4Q9FIY5_9FLAO|nr:CAP domain-containing protein [Hyunsoonleella flava]TBN03025.1 CAP domain-containing protein [Hyunsoonleella flava]